MVAVPELPPLRRSDHVPVEELRVGYWNVAPLWGEAGAGLSPLWRSGAIPVWGVKGVVLEW